MNASTNCPDALSLRQFLDGSELTNRAWSQDRIELHVNECDACQKAIERLVAGKESWEGAAQQLAEFDARRSDSSSETPALRGLMEHEKDRLPVGTDLPDSHGNNSATTSLDFLQPTDQPDSRGRLGAYEILDVVGHGGMGLVLKAYDPSLRRIVAIKVMAAHLASSGVARKRFVREARAAAAVSHDHVVAIFAVEENQNPPFLVMQFIGGKTLQERLIASGPLAVTEILRIGMQTASGLAAAHAQGLVHRDIKPANILLENGVERVKITDFGLARAVDDVSMTRTGIVAGTPQYMAPEQANGESIDVRSDLFSLGSVMYTLCTGRPPFRATTTMGLLKRICEETPRSIRELNPDVPAWLDAVIAKLLKKNPADRYQSAREVAQLLEHWLAHIQRPTTVPAPLDPIVSNGAPTAIEAKPRQVNVEGPRAFTETMASTKSRLVLWGDYSHSVPFSGDFERAFDLASASLTFSGFTLNDRTESGLRLTGPGLNSLKENVLGRAASIEISRQTGMLRLNANLSPIRILHGALFMVAVLASLAVYVMIREEGHGLFALTWAWNVFFFIALFIAWSILATRLKIRRTFDNFLSNLAKFHGKNTAASSNSDHRELRPVSAKLTSWSLSRWNDYSLSIPFAGNINQAFDFAVTSLDSEDFVLRQRTASQLRLTWSGRNLFRRDAMAAAYSIELHSDAGTISLDAKFGALKPFLQGLLFAVTSLCLIAYYFLLSRHGSNFGFAALTAITFSAFVGLVNLRSRLKLQKIFEDFLQHVALAGDARKGF